MSLIKCYECEKEISDLASDCPSCGAPRHIIISIKKADIESVKKYLSAGGDVNAQYDNFTPLHTSICEGHINIVELLIANGADVNESNINGYKPIFSAISFRRKEILKFLISKGADVNAFEKRAELSPLFAALYSDCEGKNEDITKVEMQKEIANILISNGADLNYKNRGGLSCLHIAAMFGNHEIADFLIGKGIDLNLMDVDGNTALDLANLSLAHIDDIVENSLDAQCAKSAISDLLKEHGAKTGGQLLIAAVEVGPIEEIKQHIANGVDVNVQNNQGRTPLHQAVDMSRKEVVELLIANSADVDANTIIGSTPLHHAVTLGIISGHLIDEDIAELLITAGANVNAKRKSKHGDITPLDEITPIKMKWDQFGKNCEQWTTLLRKHGAKTAEELKAEGK